MRIFVTGASGFIGRAVVSELQAAGHSVLALARNDEASSALAKQGLEVHRGALEYPETLVVVPRSATGSFIWRSIMIFPVSW